MPAVVPSHPLPPDQANADLVDERRGLEADVGALTGDVAGRDPVQLVVHERHHAVERFGAALAPGAKEVGDLALVAAAGRRFHSEGREGPPV